MNEEEILEIEEDVVIGEMPLSDEILELYDTEDEIPSSSETLGLDDAEDDSIYSTDSISTTNNNYRGSRGSFLNAMPNNILNRNSNDSNMLKNVLNKNRNQNQSKMNASARNASESSSDTEKKDGVVEQAKDKAVEAAEKVTKEAVSKIVTAKTGSGALGEAAGKAASKLVGPALEKKKKMMKLQLIGIVASISVFFIIIMIPTIYLASDGDIKTSESASRTNYLYGTGSDADLYAYLIELGVCDTRDECANSQAASFYKELRRVIKSNSNLTQKQADSFIIKMIFYNRDDNDAYAASKEIEYIANIISSQGKFDLEKAELYKNEFIKEDSYFNTYRSDLISSDKNTLEYKGEIYDEVVQQAKTLAQKIVYSNPGLTETNSGFLKRISRALRDNEYFYGDNASNEGECAWYAVRRTNEILATAGSNSRVSSGGNGRDFCYSSDYAKFNKVYDVQDLKPGMAISWSGGSGHDFGHVAIIEDVYYDENGKIKSVDLSEGSNSAGSGYNTMYKGNYINNNYIWSLANGSYKNQIRQYNCEGSLDGSTGTGCQKFVNVPINQIKNRWGSYKFICGIDLLSGDE